MTTFRYKPSAGGPAGTIDAPDRASAVRMLMSRGVSPISVEAEGGAVSSAEPAAKASGGSARRMSRADLAMFIRELATAVSAGLPIVLALRTIAKQGRKPAQKAMLQRIIERIEQGKSLADACAAEGNAFGELTINLIRAGEASGKLETVLMQAADLLDRDVKIRRSVLSATLYPMILAGLISIAVVIIVTVIVPNVLSKMNADPSTLPWPTRVVRGFAGFVGTYWVVLVLGGIGAVVGAGRLYAQPGFRLWFDRTLLKVPLLGRVLADVAVSRFTRTLGTLVSAGIPAVAALRVTRGTLGNKAMESVIEEVCEKVTGGATLAEPMERSGYFPPMLVQIINLGERSGRLDALLNQAATAFEERTEMSIKLFLTALPPLLVVVLAGVVGFVIMSILLALLQMQESIR